MHCAVRERACVRLKQVADLIASADVKRALCGCVATPSERGRENLLRNCVICPYKPANSYHGVRWKHEELNRLDRSVKNKKYIMHMK